MNFIKISASIIFLFILNSVFGQQQIDSTLSIKEILDSLYINEVEEIKGKPKKILHAEPLYIDLIRDLGARKGEKEWNIGIGMSDNRKFDEYLFLVEYEFAPIDRLGLEIEFPFLFYSKIDKENNLSIPKGKLQSTKLASQYTFLVNDKFNLSMAAGYIHEFLMPDFNQYKSGSIFNGNVYNPFLIVAKRWTDNIHSLVYAGPVIEKLRTEPIAHKAFNVNSSFHYMIRGTRNFIGMEINTTFEKYQSNVVFRPQMRISMADNLIIGIVSGIPLKRYNEGLSTFMRIIYEPGHNNLFPLKRNHKI